MGFRNYFGIFRAAIFQKSSAKLPLQFLTYHEQSYNFPHNWYKHIISLHTRHQKEIA